MLGIRTAEELAGSPLAGPVWETLVGSELRRALLNAGRQAELFFWRDRQREVDFVLHRAGRFKLAEAKWTELPDAKDTANLRAVAAELRKNSAGLRAVICRCANAFPLGEGVQAVPLGGVGDLVG